MSSVVDSSPYLKLPRFGVSAGTALATGLRTAAPARMPAGVRVAADRMIAARDELLASWQRESAPEVTDRRPAGYAMDRAWGDFHARLKAYARLPIAHHPEAARAVAILSMLFPDGLTFVQRSYRQEWAESQKRLSLIGDAQLEGAIAELVGPPFLDQVRRAHRAHGAALGITQRSPARIAPSRGAKLGALRRAMHLYVLRILALLDDDEESAASVRRALGPIDELRAAQRRRSKGAAGNGAGTGVGTVAVS